MQTPETREFLRSEAAGQLSHSNHATVNKSLVQGSVNGISPEIVEHAKELFDNNLDKAQLYNLATNLMKDAFGDDFKKQFTWSVLTSPGHEGNGDFDLSPLHSYGNLLLVAANSSQQDVDNKGTAGQTVIDVGGCCSHMIPHGGGVILDTTKWYRITPCPERSLLCVCVIEHATSSVEQTAALCAATPLPAAAPGFRRMIFTPAGGIAGEGVDFLKGHIYRFDPLHLNLDLLNKDLCLLAQQVTKEKIGPWTHDTGYKTNKMIIRVPSLGTKPFPGTGTLDVNDATDPVDATVVATLPARLATVRSIVISLFQGFDIDLSPLPFFHLTWFDMLEQELPAHVDEPGNCSHFLEGGGDGPGLWIVAVQLSGYPGTIEFHRPRGSELEHDYYLHTSPGTVYAFSGPLRMFWTHGIKTIVPKTNNDLGSISGSPARRMLILRFGELSLENDSIFWKFHKAGFISDQTPELRLKERNLHQKCGQTPQPNFELSPLPLHDVAREQPPATRNIRGRPGTTKNIRRLRQPKNQESSLARIKTNQSSSVPYKVEQSESSDSESSDTESSSSSSSSESSSSDEQLDEQLSDTVKPSDTDDESSAKPSDKDEQLTLSSSDTVKQPKRPKQPDTAKPSYTDEHPYT
jgi:hypothetical protein